MNRKRDPVSIEWQSLNGFFFKHLRVHRCDVVDGVFLLVCDKYVCMLAENKQIV